MGGFEISQIIDLLYVGLFSLIGFSIRMVKKFARENLHPIDYLRCFAVRTISSWLTITGASVTVYLQTHNMDALSYITMAYMADSLINKTPSEDEVAEYREAVARRKALKELALRKEYRDWETT